MAILGQGGLPLKLHENMRGNWHIEQCPVAAAATFVAGDLVARDADGNLVAAIASVDSNYVPTNNPIFGIAMISAADARNTALHPNLRVATVYRPIDATSQIAIQAWHATPASSVISLAAETQGTNLKALIAEIRLLASGQYVMDISATTNVALRLVDLVPTFTNTEQYPLCWASFNLANVYGHVN